MRVHPISTINVRIHGSNRGFFVNLSHIRRFSMLVPVSSSSHYWNLTGRTTNVLYKSLGISLRVDSYRVPSRGRGLCPR